MNTPAHAVFNLLVLGRQEQRGYLLPVAIGAVLPDLPMVWFYIVHKLFRSTPEAVIWNQSYFEPAWQSFFDTFNSLPIIGLGLVLAAAFGARRLAVLFGSMGLHALTDLPLHAEDAHRHFFPFSDWRFQSPVSYWDPQHFGLYVALAEVAMVVVGALVLGRRYRSPWAKGLVGLVAAGYAAYLAYVFVVWV